MGGWNGTAKAEKTFSNTFTHLVMFNVTVQILDRDSGLGPPSPEQRVRKTHRKRRPTCLPPPYRLLPALKPRLLRFKWHLICTPTPSPAAPKSALTQTPNLKGLEED